MADEERRPPGLLNAAFPENYVEQGLDDRGEMHHINHADGGLNTHAVRTDTGGRVELSGRPPQNEAGARRVSELLADALTRETGTVWKADPEGPPSDHLDVDWYIRCPPRNYWAVQITRAGSEERWRRIGRGERLIHDLPSAEGAAEIWAAIERKRHHRGGILAIDVGPGGAHAFRQITDEFIRVYGTGLQDMDDRFGQVWLVGYTAETTTCIYRAPRYR